MEIQNRPAFEKRKGLKFFLWPRDDMYSIIHICSYSTEHDDQQASRCRNLTDFSHSVYAYLVRARLLTVILYNEKSCVLSYECVQVKPP